MRQSVSLQQILNNMAAIIPISHIDRCNDLRELLKDKKLGRLLRSFIYKIYGHSFWRACCSRRIFRSNVVAQLVVSDIRRPTFAIRLTIVHAYRGAASHFGQNGAASAAAAR